MLYYPLLRKVLAVDKTQFLLLESIIVCSRHMAYFYRMEQSDSVDANRFLSLFWR